MTPTPKKSTGLPPEEFARRMNRMQHGEYTTFKILQEMISQFLAVSKNAEFLSVVDYLEKNFTGVDDFKLLSYFQLMKMFIGEFKKIADKDPIIKELLDAGERMAFVQSLGGPKL